MQIPNLYHPTRRLSAFLLSAAVAAALGLCIMPSRVWGEQTAGTITRLTTDGRSFTRVGQSWSPDGNWVLFIKEFDTSSQLWIARPDGSDARAVSKAGYQTQSGWAPDSRKIIYVYADSRDLAVNMEATLMLYDVTSGRSRPLVAAFRLSQFDYMTGARTVHWTNDSSKVAMFIRPRYEAQAAIYLIDIETGRYTCVTPNNFQAGIQWPGSWSPDSSQFALTSCVVKKGNFQVWVCNQDGSGLTPITPIDWPVWSDPAWSPRGDVIAFCNTHQRLEEEKNTRYADIWLISPDGKNARPLTHGRSTSLENRFGFLSPGWVMGGDYLVCQGKGFSPSGSPYDGIYLVDARTGDVTPVLVNDPDSDQLIDGYDTKIPVSPDGRKIAFSVRQRTILGRKTSNPVFQDERHIVYYYDIPTRTLHEVARACPKDDGVALWVGGTYCRAYFSPTGDRLLFVKAKVLSLTDKKYAPDIYVCQLETPVTMPPPQAEAPSSRSESAALSSRAAMDTGEFLPKTAVLVNPRHRKASQIMEALPEAYRSICRVDPGLNALVVAPTDEATLESLRRDVALLDRPASQIMVDVLVTELTEEATRQLGLDWQAAKGKWGMRLPLGGLDPGQVIFQGIGKLDKQFFATLSALEEEGKAAVRANPRVLTSGGTEAMISIRRTDNFLYESGTDNQGRAVRSRSDISADTILKISPHLLATDKIAMKLDATVDSFIFGARGDLPDTTRRQAVTDVVCADGETVIIGGLTLEEDTRKVKKMPLMGDLPLVGHLFRSESRSRKKSNLVIFVSPHVVREGMVPAAMREPATAPAGGSGR